MTLSSFSDEIALFFFLYINNGTIIDKVFFVKNGTAFVVYYDEIVLMLIIKRDLVYMKYSLIMIMLLVCPLFVGQAYSQDNVAIKTNLLYGGVALTPNIGVEIGLGKNTTIDVVGGYNWFNLEGLKNNNKKLAHWIVQPEFRYYLCERFNGHFFGFHGLYSQYNIGGYELPMLFGKGSRNFRHSGTSYGAGLSYGYQLILGKRWNLELNVGAGYMRMEYDKYNCERCGDFVGTESNNYFGLTKAGISIIFLIN